MNAIRAIRAFEDEIMQPLSILLSLVYFFPEKRYEIECNYLNDITILDWNYKGGDNRFIENFKDIRFLVIIEN